MTINEIINIVGGTSSLNSNKKIKDIKIDSRKIKKGDLYIAIKGSNYDGNKYAKEALDNGAIACIVEYGENVNYITVNSTIDSLHKLSSYIRDKYNIPLIGITGSNGKTTTKDLIAHILSSKYKVLKNEGSKNNIIGISNTLFKLDDTYDIIVMEFGTNHMGEIKDLSDMIKPNVGVITNIGSSHLEYFKTRKNIFKEKISILDESKLMVNGDDKYLKKLNSFKCGSSINNDLIAYNIESFIDKITFNIYLDKEYKVVFNNPGIHFVNDILLAIKVCLDYKMDIKDIIDRIYTFKLTNMRMNIINYKDNIIIDDSYNSSFESLSAGLNYLKNINKDKIIVIGDILELGKYSKRIHKKINKVLKSIPYKEVYTIGKYSKYIKGINFDNVDLFIGYFDNLDIHNKIIYIKGSRRMNLDKIVKYLKK